MEATVSVRRGDQEVQHIEGEVRAGDLAHGARIGGAYPFCPLPAAASYWGRFASDSCGPTTESERVADPLTVESPLL
jgi:hypothetical protein